MYGRTGELARLNRDRNDLSLHPINRQRADKAHATIVKQLKDKRLMALRLRLIKATQARDTKESEKIQVYMRAYLNEDRTTQ